MYKARCTSHPELRGASRARGAGEQAEGSPGSCRPLRSPLPAGVVVDKLVALKVVTSTTDPARIEREIYCLDLLRCVACRRGWPCSGGLWRVTRKLGVPHTSCCAPFATPCSDGNHIANLRGIERLGAPHNQWVFVMDYVDHVPVQVGCGGGVHGAALLGALMPNRVSDFLTHCFSVYLFVSFSLRIPLPPFSAVNGAVHVAAQYAALHESAARGARLCGMPRGALVSSSCRAFEGGQLGLILCGHGPTPPLPPAARKQHYTSGHQAQQLPVQAAPHLLPRRLWPGQRHWQRQT